MLNCVMLLVKKDNIRDLPVVTGPYAGRLILHRKKETYAGSHAAPVTPGY